MNGEDRLTEASLALQRGDPALAGELLIGLLDAPGDRPLQEIRALLRRAGAEGHQESQLACAVMMLNGHGGALEEPRAVKLLHEILQQATSEAVRANAHALLGDCYARGIGTAVDEDTAFDHFHEAADRGIAVCAFKIGLAYEGGLFGKPIDIPAALGCYVKAAAAGHAQAMTNIVLLYMSGKAGLPVAESVRDLLHGPLPTEDPDAAALIDSSRQALLEWLTANGQRL
ncbi:MAG: hypothetical protein QNJ92_04825 [Alphaproteobacteria bacterium]|nr:hypothetical protein [Alphaproteobacteria bacterium]